MRYSLEPKYRKYVQSYGFLSFARKIGDKHDKKLVDTSTETGIDAAKTASKKSCSKNSRSNRRFFWK